MAFVWVASSWGLVHKYAWGKDVASRGPFQPAPFCDSGTLEIARAPGGPGPSVLVVQQLKWNKAGPGWTKGHGMEQGRQKPVLSKSWAKRGRGRVWLGSGTGFSFSIQLPPVFLGVLSAASPLPQFLSHKMGLITSLWTLQSFCRRWSSISAAGKAFPKLGARWEPTKTH